MGRALGLSPLKHLPPVLLLEVWFGETGAGVLRGTEHQGGLCTNLSPRPQLRASKDDCQREKEEKEKLKKMLKQHKQVGRGKNPSRPRGRGAGGQGSWGPVLGVGGLPSGSQHLPRLLAGFWRAAAPRAAAGAAGPGLPHVPVPVQPPRASPRLPWLRRVAADPIPAGNAGRARAGTELPPFPPGEHPTYPRRHNGEHKVPCKRVWGLLPPSTECSWSLTGSVSICSCSQNTPGARPAPCPGARTPRPCLG